MDITESVNTFTDAADKASNMQNSKKIKPVEIIEYNKDKKYLGRIKFYNEDKRFGFLEIEGEKDVFVYEDSLRDAKLTLE